MADGYDANSPNGLVHFISDEITDADTGQTGQVVYLKIMDGANNGTGKAAFINGGLPVTPKGQYLTTPPSILNGNGVPLQTDINGNLKVIDFGQKTAGQDAVASYEKEWRPVRLNSGTGIQLLANAGAIKGFYVFSMAGTPTISIGDSGAAATNLITPAFTPQLGFNNLGPSILFNGGYANLVLGTGGAIDVLFFVRSGNTA